ncbi:hypothetical protein ACIRPX_16810 [Streptomyces sp. NPDC101225]|uniref:hypothetical protein n=1 Tax=Streptomyces sp. NPDC101225 TaxID=3366135 RepID=UPI0038084C6D
MHRSTTAAALLVTVAVSALTGCVTVSRAPAPGPPPAPPRPSAPHPDGAAGPRIVQAPAREALEMVGPSRSAAPTAPERREPPRATAPARRPAAPRPSRQPSRPRAARPTAGSRRPPHVELPDLGGGTDVCALGRQYGSWREDSPEAVICEQTYGS